MFQTLLAKVVITNSAPTVLKFLVNLCRLNAENQVLNQADRSIPVLVHPNRLVRVLHRVHLPLAHLADNPQSLQARVHLVRHHRLLQAHQAARLRLLLQAHQAVPLRHHLRAHRVRPLQMHRQDHQANLRLVVFTRAVHQAIRPL